MTDIRNDAARRPTIRDVARSSGLSIASVSRALKDPESVRGPTRERVIQAARELGYRLNRVAIDFRTGRTHTIMVLVPQIANPFYSEFFKGVEEAARARGYIVLIGDTAGDVEREETYFEMLVSGKSDGVVCNIGRFPQSFIDQFADGTLGRLAIVSCNRDAGIPVPMVRVDNYDAGRQAAAHLLGLGHCRFAQITGFMQFGDTQLRHAGFSDAVLAAGLELDESANETGDLTIASGRRAAEAIMSRPVRPSAIFAHNDEMALGAVHQLRSMGLRVPHDVSVVGFDDLNFSSALNPTLTTIHVPRRQWGVEAGEVLLDAVEGREVTADRVIRAALVARESSAPPPSR